ncbi:hypothetical protein TSAR_004023 [Trichomalopsis sarcophagae]|uniref:Uncharacterized protein n=1 Tax=Trichomalopsis sarcophagae TaxID=543379 RepID=A0A232F762_9HYME|nr:hypothetical protein TSAR_004023 [Trichomalopsis sarcophagae]
MYTKALILVLLGSTLILAKPAADAEAETATESSSWWNRAAGKVKSWWSSGKDAVESTLKKIKEQGRYAGELAEDGYLYLQDKGIELAKKSAEALSQEKQKWERKIQEAKQSTLDTADTIEYKVKQLQEQAKNAIEQKVQEAQQTWNQWKQEAKEAYEKQQHKQ